MNSITSVNIYHNFRISYSMFPHHLCRNSWVGESKLYNKIHRWTVKPEQKKVFWTPESPPGYVRHPAPWVTLVESAMGKRGMFGMSCTLGIPMRRCPSPTSRLKLTSKPAAAAMLSFVFFNDFGHQQRQWAQATGHRGSTHYQKCWTTGSSSAKEWGVGTHIPSLHLCRIKPVYRQRCTYATNANSMYQPM